MSEKKYKPSNAMNDLVTYYKKYMADALVRDFHIGGMVDYTTLHENWVAVLEYSEKLEKFAINQTMLFFQIMPGNTANLNNPCFLKSFVNRIADFLSIYTCKKGQIARNLAKDALIYNLWNKNNFIQDILWENKMNRQKSAEEKIKNKQRDKKYKRKKDAEESYRIAKAVSYLFFEETKHIKR